MYLDGKVRYLIEYENDALASYHAKAYNGVKIQRQVFFNHQEYLACNSYSQQAYDISVDL